MADSSEAEREWIQEFFLLETVYPQEKGEVQLTLTPQYSKESSNDALLLPVTLEYGITDQWQIEASWDTYTYMGFADERDQDGIGDLEIGTKFTFPEMKNLGLTAAIGFELTLPIADVDKELTEGFRLYEPFFVFSKEVHPRVNIHLNASFSFLDRAKESDEEEKEEEINELEVGVGSIFALTQNWRTTLELNLETNEIERAGKETALILTPGMIHSGPGTWEFGVGVPVGLTRDALDWGVVAMVTFEFGLFGEED